MGKEMDVRGSGTLALAPGQTQWTDDQAAALKQLGLSDATRSDLTVLMHQAQRTGLDPFSRQIYMIGRKDRGELKYTIQMGIDGFRIIADRRPEYRGQVGPEWCGDDGVWRDVWVSQEPPVAARVGVLRSDFAEPVWAVALFREYAQRKYDGELTSFWTAKPSLMVAKCAEALALRKAFPNDLSGLYTDDEMGQASNPTQGMGGSRGGTRELTTNTNTNTDTNTNTAADGGRRAELMQQIVSAGRERGWTTDMLTKEFRTRTGGTEPIVASVPELEMFLETVQSLPPVAATDETGEAPAPTSEGGPSKAQLAKLHAQLRDLGVKDTDRHECLSLLVLREITSANDLDPREVREVIDQLDTLLADPEPAKALDALLAAMSDQWMTLKAQQEV